MMKGVMTNGMPVLSVAMRVSSMGAVNSSLVPPDPITDKAKFTELIDFMNLPLKERRAEEQGELESLHRSWMAKGGTLVWERAKSEADQYHMAVEEVFWRMRHGALVLVGGEKNHL